MGKRILVTGACGRMGKEIIELLGASESMEYVCGIDNKEGAKVVKDFSQVNPGDVDGVIDFSLPELFSDVISWAAEHKKPIVSGTTGISEKQTEELKKAAEGTALLWSPNMSLGVALVNEMIKSFSAVSKDFDFQIEDFHHKHKKDSPSGTAKWLKQTLDESVGKETPEVASVRGGGIFGVHKIWAMSEEETIQLEHTALNRSVFAKGAVVAMEWLSSQPAGYYQLGDILKGVHGAK